MDIHRAYSLLTIKSVDDEARIIEGIASTPTPDRMGDIVEPKGAQFTLPLPLLYQHNAKQPIGHVIAASVTPEGIAIRAQIAKGVVPYIDEAWQLIKEGLIRGLSIGFRAIESDQIKNSFSLRFTKWDWLELSAVTIPANADASIQTVKSLDILTRAASGTAQEPAVRLDPNPGATGMSVSINVRSSKMKTIAEQIAGFEAKRAAHVARNEEIMNKAAEDGRTLEQPEQEEYDGLTAEMKAIDEHLVRLREHEKTVLAKATQITAQSAGNADAAAQTRQGMPVIQMGGSNLPKGTAFTRYAMALAATRGSMWEAIELSKKWKDSTPEVEITLRSAVAAADTTTSGWASQLVVAQNMASEFIELLRPMTILGKMPSLRRVPFNVTMPRATAGTTSSWVGQGLSKPVSRMTFDQVALTYHKIATIVVLTEELVRLSNPAAEAIVRQDMLEAIAQYTDAQFIDPTVAASGTTSPASITYGASSTAFTGATIATITADVSTAFGKFSTANIDLATGVWVMHPRSARFLSMLRTTQDIFAFPTITQNGGTFFGLPVITSNSVPIDTGADTYIFLINQGDILLADEGGITVDVSREASLQMDGAPQTGAQSLVSLWQNNLIGLRAERFITWKRRREAAVAIIEDVSY